MVPLVQAIMKSRGGLLAGARVLDFGCGVGRHTREFRAAGYDAAGVDRPYDGLSDDLAALPDGGAGICVSNASGDFPFPDDTFDCCFSTSVFEHVMDYEKPISEIASRNSTHRDGPEQRAVQLSGHQLPHPSSDREILQSALRRRPLRRS